MNKPDRKNKPDFHKIDKINIIKAVKHKLSNGIPVYSINAGTQDVCKIDLIFNAGTWHQSAPLIASTTNDMLAEGSKKYSSKKISALFDYYGAILNNFTDKDFAGLSFVCLNKQLDKTLGVLEDIVKNPVFPESELSLLLKNKKQQYIIETEKVKTLAQRQFWISVFGKKHPYGSNLGIKHFDKIDQKQLSDFHSRHYNAGNCKIIISGKIDDKVLKSLDTYFGSNDLVYKQKNKLIKPIPDPDSDKLHVIEKEGSVQTAIRMGKIIPGKHHEDFIGLQLLNTVFGGYFGSRLMSNIREDKGYTYGIGSAAGALLHTGYFIIVTEVASDVSKNTVKEVYREMKILREELVPENELNSVKNYVLGELLKNFDGPFALAESYRSVIDFDMDEKYFQKLIQTVKGMTSEKLNVLANKYLTEDSFYEIVAGKYN